MKPLTQTYHMQLDDGEFIDITTDNAANAIGIALRRRPGRKVVQCFTGGRYGELLRDHQYYARMDYDIPPHEPYIRPAKGEEEVQPNLFDDAEILTESKKAKDSHG